MKKKKKKRHQKRPHRPAVRDSAQMRGIVQYGAKRAGDDAGEARSKSPRTFPHSQFSHCDSRSLCSLSLNVVDSTTSLPPPQ